MKWFKHFTNAHNDNAIKKVRMKYGADGYAIYWYCLELIAGDLDQTQATFELSHDAEVIGYDLKIDQLRVEEIMQYMVSLNLFQQVNNTITCLKLAKFLDKKNTRNQEIHAIIDSISVADSRGQLPDNSGQLPDCRTMSPPDKKRREENKDRASPTTLTVPIPENWKPNETNQQWMTDSHVSEFEQSAIIRDFVDFWKLSGSKKKNWDLAFRKNPVVARRVNTANKTKSDSDYMAGGI